MTEGVANPVVFCQMYSHSQEEKGDFQLEAAADSPADGNGCAHGQSYNNDC